MAGEFYTTGQLLTTLDGTPYTITCSPILPKEVWEQSLEVRKANKCEPKNVKRDYLCAGLVYCACGWRCHGRAVHSNRAKGYTSVRGVYACAHGTLPETRPETCVDTIGSQKVDTHVWNSVKRVCENPAILQNVIQEKLADLQAKRVEYEAAVADLQRRLERIAHERRWVIEQARKGNITESEMVEQLEDLRRQEYERQRELGDFKALLARQGQAATLTTWTGDFLREVHAGIDALEIDVARLNDQQLAAFHAEFEASHYADKFSGGQAAQLRWAILEEKRRIVKALVEKVVVGRVAGQRERSIEVVFALEVPTDLRESIKSSDWWRK